MSWLESGVQVPMPAIGEVYTHPDYDGTWRVTKIGPWRISLARTDDPSIVRRLARRPWAGSGWERA